MLKQGLSIDTTFYPPYFSLDSTFKRLRYPFMATKYAYLFSVCVEEIIFKK
jgi:hypothetical protein